MPQSCDATRTILASIKARGVSSEELCPFVSNVSLLRGRAGGSVGAAGDGSSGSAVFAVSYSSSLINLYNKTASPDPAKGPTQ